MNSNSKIRPDEEKFLQLSSHLSRLDTVLYNYAVEQNLELVKNAKRQPGRELHRNGNPLLMFGIYLDGSWLHLDYHKDLPHNVIVSALYISSTAKRFVKNAAVVERQPFSLVEAHLTQLIDDSWSLLNSWRMSVNDGDESRILSRGWRQVYPK